jgi:hypothetical protein
MNTTENTKVWEAPVLIIELLECTESGIETLGGFHENTLESYVPTSV